MLKVFICGDQGTTGLRIGERLGARPDVTLLTLSLERRKDVDAQAELAAKADATFLCLPDSASKALIEALGDEASCVLDTSTAFRTDDRFAYGFPELSPAFAQRIKTASRIAVPGCHASGCISLLYPLLQAGVIAPDAPLSLTSITGYTGGGKKMIAEYEAEGRDPSLASCLPYGVNQQHKHLPEIVHVCGLAQPPVFQPVLGDFPRGMLVSLPLQAGLMQKHIGLDEMTALYRAHYAGQPLIRVLEPNPSARIASNFMADSDAMEIFLTGNDDRMIACSRFDNLGKGASGAAIECMNLRFGLPAETGLNT
ncbi:MAG: N-acetyl-gamma-glutamyl-phosphate reductase [Eubacteriales bacterium]|nr:N-acetyl-gamma-glutamyl-phosphate reductase [Eubacteriales bacterium]